MQADKLAIQKAVLSAPRKLEFRSEEIEVGGLGPQDVVARTRLTVLSPGTEVGAFVGLPPLRPSVVYPRLVGYCNLAEVVAAGPEVKGLSPGDRILTFESHCSGFRTSASTVITSVPADLPPQRAAATYLYHLGYSALLRSGFTPGLTVAVVGLGTLGLATVSLGSALGANMIAFSDQDAGRRRALAAGARAVYAKNEIGRALAESAAMGARAGIDVVVSTSNRWDDWDLALRLPRKGGTIAVLGFPGRDGAKPANNPLASEFFYDRQLSVQACGYMPDLDVPPHDLRFTIKRNCVFLLDLIRRGAINPDLLVTETRPWHELGAVYERLAAHDPNLVTCALDWTPAEPR
ncbi:MAG TPA: zinc-binding alcohol dehydrogenase [Polyangia bacterium]|jgi:2-desacetyl-2-hydroxyethyl bacteriochlorophyllide A dehydrogenase